MTETIATPLTERLGCRYPIISAGMGGPARSELAAAVSGAGGFGQLGMVREPARLIEQEIAATKRLTNRPFAVNLIPACTRPELLADELAACFHGGVAAMSFFWDVDAAAVGRAKKEGCLVLHQVGSVADAKRAEDAGAVLGPVELAADRVEREAVGRARIAGDQDDRARAVEIGAVDVVGRGVEEVGPGVVGRHGASRGLAPRLGGPAPPRRR